MDRLVTGFDLIEGPLWQAGRGLLFSDVLRGGVYRLSPDGSVETVFAHRRGVGGMAFHEAGGLIVSGGNISFKPFDGSATRKILDRDPENDNVGYNDLVTDLEGRVWVGSLGSSPVFDDGRPPIPGSLHVIDLDGTSRIQSTGIELTNGLGFSPDGSTLYHSDSRAGVVWKYPIDRLNGKPVAGARSVFAQSGEGSPDGLAVAEDGSVWVALAHGSAVWVLEADGTERHRLPVPLPMVTSLCFGGDDLRDLYVVTGSQGASEKLAGSIFVSRVDVAGLPRRVARVALPPAP